MTASDLIAECADRLRPFVDEFGSGVVERAARYLVDSDPAEQARIRADVRRALGMDSCRSILSAELFAELFPEDRDQAERLAQVIPFPTRPVGGAA